MRVKAGILGCGKVAHLHAKAMQQSELCDLVGVWSRSSTTARDFAQTYKVSHHPDVTSLVIKEKLDFVVVCTPHPFHLQPAMAAINAGAHVLVEKPLASSLGDCDAMILRAAKRGVKLGVISQRRWYPPAIRVKEAIDKGKIGKPRIGTVQMLGWRDRAYYESDAWRGTWRDEGGGVLVNQAPHQLDLLLWYMGEIDELYGMWHNINHPYIEVEDTAMALIRFRNGGIGNILVSNSQKPGIYGKVHVHGENGASVGVQTESGAMFIAGMSEKIDPPLNDIWTISGEETLPEKWRAEDEAFFKSIDPAVYFIQKQIDDFASAVSNDLNPMVDGLEGRRTVELFTGIYQSQFERTPLKFPLKA